MVRVHLGRVGFADQKLKRVRQRVVVRILRTAQDVVALHPGLIGQVNGGAGKRVGDPMPLGVGHVAAQQVGGAEHVVEQAVDIGAALHVEVYAPAEIGNE